MAAPLTMTSNRAELDRDLVSLARRLGNVRNPLMRWGQRTAKTARENARAKGGRRFWFEVARSVSVRTVGAEAVSVATDHVAAAQKQYGGMIEAKNAKALTIPVSEEAKGRRASEFEGGGRKLFVLPSQSGDPSAIGVLGYDDDGTFHGLFALRRRLKAPQRAEPWWPTVAEVAEFGRAEFARWIGEQLQKK